MFMPISKIPRHATYQRKGPVPTITFIFIAVNSGFDRIATHFTCLRCYMCSDSRQNFTESGSRRSHEVQPFQVMAILAQAQRLQAQGVDVIHLEVGEPDFPTAEPIIKAGINALQTGKTGYTPALGLPELREKIAQYYQQRFHVGVNPERIILAPG